MTALPTPVASLSHIRAGYRGRPVLDDICLEIGPAEIVALLGPNGAGKTCLLRVLSGVLAPISGEVRIGGEARAAGERRPVRLVPQDIALYGWMTPRENCVAFARMAGLSWQAAATAADHAVRLAQCEEVATIQVARLSGGFKRRANIAAALVDEPRLLILDEPTAGVDLGARRAIMQTLGALKARGLAILVVTHDLDDAEAVADRAAFLFSGRIRCIGRPGDLVASVFGTRKRVDVLLETDPDPQQRAALAAIGAEPAAGERAWVVYRDFDRWDAGAFVGGLEAGGLAVRAVTMRPPDLQSLYAHLDAA